MNEIVRRHYPVSRLPDDLREGLAPDGLATVSIAPEPRGVEAELSLEQIFALADRLPRRTADDIDAEVGALRAEWHERD